MSPLPPITTSSSAAPPPAEVLLDIIQTQAEIAKAGLDLGEVMAQVCKAAQRLTNAAGAVVELIEDDEMVYRAVTGITELQLGLRIKRSGSLSGLCAQQKQILYCEDTLTDTRVDRVACQQVGIRSMITVPLNFLDETVGILKVISRQASAFTETNIQALGLIADLVGASMFHATQTTTQAMQQLYHLATHDSLTGLANRSLFFDRLRKTLARCERQKSSTAVLVVDMDNLKTINDNLGHRTGDACLQELSKRMRQMSRSSDTVARLGGDEFALIVEGVKNRESAKLHIQRLQHHIDTAFQFEQHKVNLAASIGLALYPDDGQTPHDLLEKADLAMYYSKHKRKTA